MPASRIKDPDYEIKIDLTEAEEVANGSNFLILDNEGNWCKIPQASTTEALIQLIEKYFKPKIVDEFKRLKNIKDLMYSPNSLAEDQFVLDIGLFYYKPPHTGTLEEAQWVGGLAEKMRAAGLPVNPIPEPLAESTRPHKNDFLNQYIDPLNYWSVSGLLTKTFILSPALCIYEPDLAAGETLAMGYNAAIAVDGSVILQLLSPDDININVEYPNLNNVYIVKMREVILNLLNGTTN